MLTPNLSVTITKQVYDFMVIEVYNADGSKSFDYTITDQANQHLRRGYFKGPLVQMRLSLLQEGSYHFSLYSKDGLITSIPFEKKAGNFDGMQWVNK